MRGKFNRFEYVDRGYCWVWTMENCALRASSCVVGVGKKDRRQGNSWLRLGMPNETLLEKKLGGTNLEAVLLGSKMPGNKVVPKKRVEPTAGGMLV
jgi:hypothetical protein